MPASAAPAIVLVILLLALCFVRPIQMVFRLDGREAAEWWYNAPVPNHKELAKGTLRSLIRRAGLTVEEFRRLL